MELTDRFHVGAPPERAWSVLVDLERVAPCVPGAELQEVDGDVYRGVVRVRTGPIVTRYRGSAAFVEKDPDARRLVLRASGGDAGREKGSAVVTATLHEAGAGTEVRVAIDLALAGGMAHLGRAVVADVGTKLVDRFAACLAAGVLSAEEGTGSGGPASGAPGTTAVRTATAPAPPIDILALGGRSLARRAVPAITSLGALMLLRRRRRRRGRAA